MIDGLFLVEGAIVGAFCVAYFIILRPVTGIPAPVFLSTAAIISFGVGQHIALAALLLLVAIFVRRRAGQGLSIRRPGWTEGALHGGLIGSGYLAFMTARVISEGGYREARDNSLSIINFEKALGIFVEPQVQRFVMQSQLITELMMTVYVYLFFTIVVAVAFWLFLVDERHFIIYRNSLGVAAAIAVVLFSTFPVAPPRLVPGAEIIDVGLHIGRPQTFTNEYAAVPSLHVGWLMLAGFMISRVATVPWVRVLAFAPGCLMAVIVVATGNHYIVDWIIGTVISVVPAAIMVWGADRTGLDRLRSRPTSPAG